MDIEYQLDPATNTIFHQLSTAPTTRGPTDSGVAVKQGVSYPVWNQPQGNHPPASIIHPSNLERGNIWPVSASVPVGPVSVPAGPASVPALHPTSSLDLQETLNKIQVSLQQHQMTPYQPPVVVVNNLPPPTSGGWSVEPDHVAVGGAVATILVVVICGFLFWLRRYRPNAWDAVKVHTIRILRFLALPASWLCGKAAGLLRSFHQDTSQVSNFCLL
jgi:hypothetical protein